MHVLLHLLRDLIRQPVLCNQDPKIVKSMVPKWTQLTPT